MYVILHYVLSSYACEFLESDLKFINLDDDAQPRCSPVWYIYGKFKGLSMGVILYLLSCNNSEFRI